MPDVERPPPKQPLTNSIQISQWIWKVWVELIYALWYSITGDKKNLRNSDSLDKFW